jgi:hypothetical protein
MLPTACQDVDSLRLCLCRLAARYQPLEPRAQGVAREVVAGHDGVLEDQAVITATIVRASAAGSEEPPASLQSHEQVTGLRSDGTSSVDDRLGVEGTSGNATHRRGLALLHQPHLDLAAQKAPVPADHQRRQRCRSAARVLVDARARHVEQRRDLLRGQQRLIERRADERHRLGAEVIDHTCTGASQPRSRQPARSRSPPRPLGRPAAAPRRTAPRARRSTVNFSQRKHSMESALVMRRPSARTTRRTPASCIARSARQRRACHRTERPVSRAGV